MRRVRKIIEIDEEKCTGCGKCIIACAQRAILLLDGKAKLVSEFLCDGLGDCIGECPEGAITIVEKEAEEFLGKNPEKISSFSCFQKSFEGVLSNHTQWPIKLRLISPSASFLKEKELALVADCAAFAYRDVHTKILTKYSVASGCPKFDDVDEYIEILSEIIEVSLPKSIVVYYMEVPCCSGFLYLVKEALEKSGINVEVRGIKIGIDGSIQEEVELTSKNKNPNKHSN